MFDNWVYLGEKIDKPLIQYWYDFDSHRLRGAQMGAANNEYWKVPPATYEDKPAVTYDEHFLYHQLPWALRDQGIHMCPPVDNAEGICMSFDPAEIENDELRGRSDIIWALMGQGTYNLHGQAMIDRDDCRYIAIDVDGMGRATPMYGAHVFKLPASLHSEDVDSILAAIRVLQYFEVNMGFGV